ncbi:MAG: acyl-CoA/acyl-ACP dehydrogenase [Gammaproteobacteria bacterium]|nr:acyl-CoA/acyl-ACP dehydrogenase [Gammaproteobacteria bacterium]NND38810.1 acyl-CoA/acyl-ACP dehydrogenase [Pseudomonadales bacterium]
MTASPSANSPAANTATAKQAIAAARAVVNQSLTNIRLSCLDGKSVSPAKLEQQQWVSFDLARSAAELAAAEHTLEYAAQANTSGSGELEASIACAYTAEMFNNLRARLAPRLRDFQLPGDVLETSLGDTAILQWVAEQSSVENIVALGDSIRASDGHLGASVLDQEHQFMAETFGRFAIDVVDPLAEHIHRNDADIPDDILDPLKEMGVFGLSVPEQYGGLQPDDREDNMGMIVVTESLSRGSLGAAGSLITRPEILAKTLLAGGTDQQKQQWLPKLATGEIFNAIAVTEPDYGSDVAGIKLPATKVDGGWSLTGAKTWCTFCGKANVMLVLARTDPDPAAKHRGLTVLLVEKPSYPGHEFEHRQDGGGYMRAKAIPTIGYRGMHSFEVYFENYFVPDANVVGGEAGIGKGFYHVMKGFSGGRIQTAARAVGLMQSAFEKALGYANDRKVFGSAIGDYQLTRVKLARMGMLLQVSRQFTYAVGRLLDKGEGQMEASLVKFLTCNIAEWVTREALQIHGGMGYAEETAVSRYFVDARVLSIFEGAEETLALKVIARNLIENAGS